MRFEEPIGPETPDPFDDVRRLVAEIPVPLARFAEQPHLESLGWNSFAGDTEEAMTSESLMLWREPADRDHPANLADIGAWLEAQLQVPPELLPPWADELRRRMRYPQLADAVRTTWRADGVTEPVPELRRHVDAAHANGIDQGVSRPFSERVDDHHPMPIVTPRPIREGDVEVCRVSVDDRELAGFALIGDPVFVGMACRLPTGGVMTCVIDRAALAWADLVFTTGRP